MQCPAKLNLSLKVLGKREDGFHEIETLMVKLPGLADELEIRPADEFKFSCSDTSLPTDDSNLVVKAANALIKASGEPLNFDIHLEKKIPHGAGLGGGSSDAATALLALNSQLANPLSIENLHAIAADLGSDVPFFLYDGAAQCTGRGEIVTGIPDLPEIPVVLFKPPFAVATPQAYGDFAAARDLPNLKNRPQRAGDLLLENDLEAPVFQKHRYLAELKTWLINRRDTKAALLSGSGSTIFAILRPNADPDRLINTAHKYFDPNLWTWSGRF